MPVVKDLHIYYMNQKVIITGQYLMITWTAV